jgi:hypothetical protein
MCRTRAHIGDHARGSIRSPALPLPTGKGGIKKQSFSLPRAKRQGFTAKSVAPPSQAAAAYKSPQSPRLKNVLRCADSANNAEVLR